MTPDEKFIIEYDFQSCPRKEIKASGEYLKIYQERKQKRQREV